MVLEKGRANTDNREDKRKEEEEEEEEEKRKEERRKGKRRSQVWNLSMDTCLGLYGIVKFRMERSRFLYNSMDLCMVWVWKLPISFLVRIKLRRALRILDLCFRKGLVAS